MEKIQKRYKSIEKSGLSMLTSGTYFISVFDGMQTEVSKVIKL